MSAENIVIQKVVMSAIAVAQADTHYSDALPFAVCDGALGILVVSTAGTITVTQQASLDGITFYDVVDGSGNAQGTVCTAKAVTTGTYVVINPVMAPYTRFKVVETNTAPTVVTLTAIFSARRRG